MRLATSLAGAAILLCASAAMALNPTSNVQEISGKGLSQGIPNPIIINTGGDDIGSATPIVALPYSDGGNTCAYAANYASTCGLSGAPDVVYSYVAGADINVDIALCGSSYDTEVFVLEDSAANQIACNDDFCGLQSTLQNVHFTAGHTYYIVVSGFSTSCGDYVINIVENTPCIINCPPGSLSEGEPACGPNYVDNYNGGCNSVPPVWTTIPCGASQTVCGTYGGFTYSGLSYRDTDWYEITLAAPATITWCVAGEYNTLLGIIDGSLGCPVTAFYDYTYGLPCAPACVSQTLAAGTWWLFVATDGFGSAIGCGLD